MLDWRHGRSNRSLGPIGHGPDAVLRDVPHARWDREAADDDVLMPRAHGTRSRFTNDRCRCEPCCRASREYEEQRAKTFNYFLPYLPPADDEWMLRAECKKRGLNPEHFYPSKGPGENERMKAALAVCKECPEDVKAACLEFALDNKIDWGVWGGRNAKQRYQLRRRMSA